MRKYLLLALSLLGLFDALYLLWVYTSPSRPIVCLGTGCDAVRASPYAHPFGLPMPVFGVAAYLVLGVLILAEDLFSENLGKRSPTRSRAFPASAFCFPFTSPG